MNIGRFGRSGEIGFRETTDISIKGTEPDEWRNMTTTMRAVHERLDSIAQEEGVDLDACYVFLDTPGEIELFIPEWVSGAETPEETVAPIKWLPRKFVERVRSDSLITSLARRGSTEECFAEDDSQLCGIVIPYDADLLELPQE